MFISTRPAEKVRNEISLIIGYRSSPAPSERSRSARANFALYTQSDGAWIKNAAEEPRMVDAMRKGADIVVKARVGAGHQDDRHVFAQRHRAGARPRRAGVPLDS